jgi:hypothetical protein
VKHETTEPAKKQLLDLAIVLPCGNGRLQIPLTDDPDAIKAAIRQLKGAIELLGQLLPPMTKEAAQRIHEMMGGEGGL